MIPGLTVCADDYGLSPGIDRAILELFALQRLSATSCMTLFPEWEESSKALMPFIGKVDVGLHLVLTDFMPLSGLNSGQPMPSFAVLMKKCFFRQLKTEELLVEMQAQLDRFIKAFGVLPSHIDGHQHVHLLPVVREALMRLYETRLHGSGCYIRNCSERVRSVWQRGVACRKSLLLSFLGRPLQAKLQRASIPCNNSFTGIYPFDGADYSQCFSHFLIGLRNKPLMLCHPGYVDEVLKARDSLLYPREAELAFLKSENYMNALKQSGLTPSRFAA